jgi:hypothetical protein
MMKTLTLAAVVAALAVPAFAQQGGGRPQRSPEEMEAAFTKADANKDGKLTPAEFKETLPEQFKAQVTDDMLPQIIARRDTDKDGFVSKAEFMAPPAPRPAQ